jgi:hypothetical protein
LLQSLFDIDAETGELFVSAALNREVVEEVTLPVFAEDTAAPSSAPQNATALLFVTLLDVNDNAPRFVPTPEYSARVSEAAQPGSEVKQVLAVDPDRGEAEADGEGRIAYSIVYDEANPWMEAFEVTEENRYTGRWQDVMG